MITVLSVVWLGEGLARAGRFVLGVGFIGVLLIVRPGTVSFNLGSVLL